mgnify:CR=1 FL=1
MTDLAAVDEFRVLTNEETKATAAAISRALRRAARESRKPAPIIVGGGGGGVRARRGDQILRIALILSFVVSVLIPTLSASIYWGLIASKQYVTEAQFTLRSGESSPLDSLGGFGGLATSRQSQDTQIIANYIKSPTIIADVAETIELQKSFGRSDIDYFSRLAPNEPIEKLEKYWRKQVDVKIENSSGIVTITVRAFSPEDSERLASTIVSLSEHLVNRLADRPREEAATTAKTELDRAEKALREAITAMRDLRNTQGVLDAKASAEGINKVVTALRLQLAETESNLLSSGRGIQDSPQLRILKNRADALRKQIADYSAQIAGVGGGANMAGRLNVLSIAQTDLDLARQRYADAATAYQTARVDLETQRAYVVAFLKPILAQDSVYPRRWVEWLLVVVPSLLLWGLMVTLVLKARDNMVR